MATENKPVLGYYDCGTCGERATVHSAAGRRNQLYKRCGCGCDQRNGKVVQSRLWYDTQWLPDMKPESKPARAMSSEEYFGQIDRVDRTGSGVDDSEGVGLQTEIKPEIKPENEAAKTDKAGLFWLAGGVAMLAALVGRV